MIATPRWTAIALLIGSLILPLNTSWAQAQLESSILLAPEPSAESSYGAALVVLGDLAVIGAPMADGATTQSGAAWVVDLTTDQVLFKLEAPSGVAIGGFGSAIAIEGNQVLIGAPAETQGGTGSAYLFDVTTGQHVRTYLASDGAVGDAFGISVALDALRVLVGAPLDDDASSPSGSAYLFDRQTGTQLVKLQGSTPGTGNQFGSSVAISADRLLVGHPHGLPKGVLIFNLSGQELMNLTPLHWGGVGNFGGSLAVGAAHLVVGADLGLGSVFIFDSTTGQQLHILQSSDLYLSDGLGKSVAVDGGLVVAGRPGLDEILNLEASVGSAHVYGLTSGVYLNKMRASDGVPGDQLGWAIGIDNDRIVVGTRTAGKAYVYDASGLVVAVVEEFEPHGNVGGPFCPTQQEYTLRNVGMTGLNYDVSADQPWLSIANGTGFLPAEAEVNVTVSLTAAADLFGPGNYSAVLSFVNTTDHRGDTTRLVPLEVHLGQPGLIRAYPFDSDPGWTTDSNLWQFGRPLGLGGGDGSWDQGAAGFPDPTSGHTGQNAYSYNLAGNYSDFLPEEYLTSDAIDCSGHINTRLAFWRYLNVEMGVYDHASVQVSSDGTSWTTVWQNSGGASLTDSYWRAVEYDISSVADGQCTVFLRWVMGTTDIVMRYSGWNIDDVEVWGDPISSPGVGFCFGAPQDGTPCPCSNDNDLSLAMGEAGCATGTFSSGALLKALGSASVAADDLVLYAVHATPGQPGLFFQANLALQGGSGVPFGNGLRCTDGQAVRLGLRTADAQGFVRSDGLSIAQLGNVPPGSTRHYQLWFRESPFGTCGASFNLTNGLTVTWAP